MTAFIVLFGEWKYNYRTYKVKEISWRKEHGMCKDFPENLISSKKESLALIPYGATILRMAEMPMIKTVASHNIIKNK